MKRRSFLQSAVLGVSATAEAHRTPAGGSYLAMDDWRGRTVTQPFPVPRELRQSAIFTGSGSSSSYGPFGWKIFDDADVGVYVRKVGDENFALAYATIAKVSNLPQDYFTVAFPDVLPETAEFVVISERLHERTVGITRGNQLDPTALEKELSKQGTVLQELRRDIGRALKIDFGAGAQHLPAPDSTSLLGWSLDGKLVNRPSEGASVAEAQAAAEVAIAAAKGNLVFPDRAAAAAADVPGVVKGVLLNGDGVEGDGRGGLYIDVDNGSPDTYTSNAGTRTWYRAEDVGQDRIKNFAIFDSNATERSLRDRLRQQPEVRDWDGVRDSLTHDSTVGLQRAFNESRDIFQSEDIAVRTTGPIILNRRGIHFRGGTKVGTQLHSDHDGIAIEVGDTADTVDGYAPHSVLENFSIYGRPESSGGIKLHDKESNPGWADASKAIHLRGIYIADIGNGPALRVNSWANTFDQIEIAGNTLRGLIVGEQALTNTFNDLYITGCAKEGIIAGDKPARNETCNLLFNNAKVQQCGGAPGGAVILIQGVWDCLFNQLYLERNGEKGTSYDVSITELAHNVKFFGTTNRAPPDSAVFRDAGVGTTIWDLENFGATDALIRRIGKVCGGFYVNLRQASSSLGNGEIRDMATGDAFGRYTWMQDGQIRRSLEYVAPKAASFTVTPGERAYHVQSGSATVANLPANAPRGSMFTIVASGGGVCTLTPAAGGTINNGASKPLTSNQLYTVVCTRNIDGLAAQWYTGP